VFLSHAPVDKPWRACDDDADRRLMENGGIKAVTHQWDRGHPPQKTGRAARVPVVFTRRRFALTTASRRPCEQEAPGGEPVGWQRWRRQLLDQTRDQVIVLAQGWDGIVPLAVCALLVGVKLKDLPPSVGTPHEVRAMCGLPPHR
jgi:hypothetical protein